MFFGQDKRESSIDMFRGFIILAMLTATFFAISPAVENLIPDIIKHASYDGITIAEFFAPAFVFLMGMSAVASFERRKSLGGAKAARVHLIFRACVLITLQTLINQVIKAFTTQTSVMWGILSALGISIVFALPFLGKKLWIRAVAVVGYLLVYTALCQGLKMEATVRSFTHGGIIGGMNWGCMFLIGTIINELMTHKKRLLIIAAIGLALVGLGIGMHFIIPFSKRAISVSFVLLTCGAASLAFLGFYGLSKLWADKYNFLVWVGRNAILLFLCDQALSAILQIGLLSFIYPTANVATIILGAAVNIILWSALAYLLYRKKWFLKI